MCTYFEAFLRSMRASSGFNICLVSMVAEPNDKDILHIQSDTIFSRIKILSHGEFVCAISAQIHSGPS